MLATFFKLFRPAGGGSPPAEIEVHRTNPGARVSAGAEPPHGGYYTPEFDYDGLRVNPGVIHNHDFMADPRFVRAFARGVQAQGGDNYKYYWRMYVGLWCAGHARQLRGDFVECGVWKGFLSSAIMNYLDWNSVGKSFYLFDTFNGIDETLVTDAERERLHLDHYRKYYLPNWEDAKQNFAEYRDVVLVKGSIPAALRAVPIGRVAYLSLDMNNVTPELAAAEYFWPRLVAGGVILLDDYGFVSYEEQKRGFDRFARSKGVQVLALPTGQGMIVKPG